MQSLCLSVLDVNECGAGNGGCEHFCRNEAGTHSCYCRVGYQLNADGIHCDGKWPPTSVSQEILVAETIFMSVHKREQLRTAKLPLINTETEKYNITLPNSS